MEEELPTRLGERQVAELVQDDEVDAGELIGQSAGTAGLALGLELVDEIHDVEEARLDAPAVLEVIRRILAIVSTVSTPSVSAPTRPTLHIARGSVFDADHPSKGVNIPRRFTISASRSSGRRRRAHIGHA